MALCIRGSDDCCVYAETNGQLNAQVGVPQRRVARIAAASQPTSVALAAVVVAFGLFARQPTFTTWTIGLLGASANMVSCRWRGSVTQGACPTPHCRSSVKSEGQLPTRVVYGNPSMIWTPLAAAARLSLGLVAMYKFSVGSGRARRHPMAHRKPCSFACGSTSSHRRRAAITMFAVDPWAVLGIPAGSSDAEVKRAFKEKIRKAHPDAGGSAEEFQAVRDAYKAALDWRPGATAAGVGAQQQNPGGQYWKTQAQASTPAGWTINDFYEWRREEVKREHEQWQKDAHWQDLSWQERARRQDWRQRWPGHEQRRRQEDERKRAIEEERIAMEEQLRESLRARGGPGSGNAGEAVAAEAKKASRGDFNRDMNGKWDWREFGKPPPRPKPRHEPRVSAADAAAQADGDTVVSYRMMATRAGGLPVKVPVYKSRRGDAYYYYSPITSKRVRCPAP